MNPGPACQRQWHPQQNNLAPWEKMHPGPPANCQRPAAPNVVVVPQVSPPQYGVTAGYGNQGSMQQYGFPVDTSSNLEPSQPITSHPSYRKQQQFSRMQQYSPVPQRSQGSPHMYDQQSQWQQMYHQNVAHPKNCPTTNVYPPDMSNSLHSSPVHLSGRHDNPHRLEPAKNAEVFRQGHQSPWSCTSPAAPQIQDSTPSHLSSTKRVLQSSDEVGRMPLKRQRCEMSTVPYEVQLSGYQEGLHIQGSCYLTVTKGADPPLDKVSVRTPVHQDQCKADQKVFSKEAAVYGQNHNNQSTSMGKSSRTALLRLFVFKLVALAGKYCSNLQEKYPTLFTVGNNCVCLPDELCQVLMQRVSDPSEKPLVLYYVKNQHKICSALNGGQCKRCSAVLHNAPVKKTADHQASFSQDRSNPLTYGMSSDNSKQSSAEYRPFPGQYSPSQSPHYQSSMDSRSFGQSTYTNTSLQRMQVPSGQSLHGGANSESLQMRSSAEHRPFPGQYSPSQSLQYKSSMDYRNIGQSTYMSSSLPTMQEPPGRSAVVYTSQSIMNGHQPSRMTPNCSSYGLHTTAHDASIQCPVVQVPQSDTHENQESPNTFLSESEFKDCPFGQRKTVSRNVGEHNKVTVTTPQIYKELHLDHLSTSKTPLLSHAVSRAPFNNAQITPAHQVYPVLQQLIQTSFPGTGSPSSERKQAASIMKLPETVAQKKSYPYTNSSVKPDISCFTVKAPNESLLQGEFGRNSKPVSVNPGMTFPVQDKRLDIRGEDAKNEVPILPDDTFVTDSSRSGEVKGTRNSCESVSVSDNCSVPLQQEQEVRGTGNDCESVNVSDNCSVPLQQEQEVKGTGNSCESVNVSDNCSESLQQEQEVKGTGNSCELVNVSDSCSVPFQQEQEIKGTGTNCESVNVSDSCSVPLQQEQEGKQTRNNGESVNVSDNCLVPSQQEQGETDVSLDQPDVIWLDSESPSPSCTDTSSKPGESFPLDGAAASLKCKTDLDALFSDGAVTFTTFVMDDSEDDLEITTAELGKEEWERLMGKK